MTTKTNNSCQNSCILFTAIKTVIQRKQWIMEEFDKNEKVLSNIRRAKNSVKKASLLVIAYNQSFQQ